MTNLLMIAITAAIEAGREILKFYNSSFSTELKSDHSPITEADLASHRIISEMLSGTSYPLLSEEGEHLNYESRKNWERFWLVDPLDGTREFINHNGEFTVNIAFVEGQEPTLGVICIPALDVVYAGHGSSLFKIDKSRDRLFTNASDLEPFRINVSGTIESNVIRVAASRSHLSEETRDYILELEKKYSKVEFVSAGSALKFCLLAEGSADIYPRLSPTMEWDTAAGHAILKAAGKNILVYPSGDEIRYNKPNLVNEWFIAR